jgi:hypothetical protein
MKRAVFLCLMLVLPAWPAENEATIFLTSNLGGRFPLDQFLDESQILQFAGYLREQRRVNPSAFHFDLGNAFYPGRLSRFSFGSLTADYLQMLNLDAGLIAAADLNIGAESLDYIRRARGIRLLSANIFREAKPFFEPSVTLERGGVKVTVIGLTSTKSVLNYAEAKYLDLRLENPTIALKATLGRVQVEKPDLTLVLTGLSVREAIVVLKENPSIDMILCGGDSDGLIGQEPVRSVELPDGRMAVAMPRETSLMRLNLKRQAGRWKIVSRNLLTTIENAPDSLVPPSFARRLELWQKGYAAEEDRQVKTEKLTPFTLNPEFAAASLRYAYGCDVAYLDPSDIDTKGFPMVHSVTDIRYAIQNDYDIFTYRLLGSELRSFYLENPLLAFSGITPGIITGRPVRDEVMYRICTTQRGYEFAMRGYPKRRSTGRNQWRNISNTVNASVQEGIVDPGAAADSRFHLLTIFNLSNIYETGKVATTSAITTPPGQATDSYFKWGLENDINFILYNRRHSISFNPYIFYVRQRDQVIRNLLRGDLTYTYNTEWLIKPYQKNRVDTVVVPIPESGLRPTFLRETAGAEFSWSLFTGRLGGGMEKGMLDPVTDPTWGIEATLNMLWEFRPGMKYKLGYDSFSSQTTDGTWRHRIEVGNGLIFTIADPLTFSISHRWYYFYLQSVNDFYNSSVLNLSLDLRTTWLYP